MGYDPLILESKKNTSANKKTKSDNYKYAQKKKQNR